MKYDPNIHHRRTIRLKDYDYTQPGAYFVTLVTSQRLCLFGEIAAGIMHLNLLGRTVMNNWLNLPSFFPIRLDAFVVMPNHFHGIIWIDGERTGEASAGARTSSSHSPAADASPQPPKGTQPNSLGAIIQNFKSITTRRSNQIQSSPGLRLWQRNYYEHIIRDEAELARIEAYIQANPSRWEEDREFFRP